MFNKSAMQKMAAKTKKIAGDIGFFTFCGSMLQFKYAALTGHDKLRKG